MVKLDDDGDGGVFRLDKLDSCEDWLVKEYMRLMSKNASQYQSSTLLLLELARTTASQPNESPNHILYFFHCPLTQGNKTEFEVLTGSEGLSIQSQTLQAPEFRF